MASAFVRRDDPRSVDWRAERGSMKPFTRFLRGLSPAERRDVQDIIDNNVVYLGSAKFRAKQGPFSFSLSIYGFWTESLCRAIFEETIRRLRLTHPALRYRVTKRPSLSATNNAGLDMDMWL